MISPPDPKRENPSELQLEGVSEGIEALPQRVERYGKAKTGAIDVAKYMADLPGDQKHARRLLSCGDYLVFNHYWSVDKVKLHGASLCCMHLLCPLCAIRRGSKALSAYLDRWEVIRAEKPHLRPFLVTLTVKDGEDLLERFNHLHSSQRELWKRKGRRRGSCLDGVAGAVWSYELKRGKNSGLWHPHLHMIALCENGIDQSALAAEWHNITGDSFIVDVRPISESDQVSGFMEVFKYAVKFSDQPPADTVHAWRTLGGKRLLASAGCFRGVVVPETLMDDEEGLADLPYVQLFYRYLGNGYTLTRRADRKPAGVSQKVTLPKGIRSTGQPSYSAADFRAAYELRILRAQVPQPIGKQAL
jgi:Replication protein